MVVAGDTSRLLVNSIFVNRLGTSAGEHTMPVPRAAPGRSRGSTAGLATGSFATHDGSGKWSRKQWGDLGRFHSAVWVSPGGVKISERSFRLI